MGGVGSGVEGVDSGSTELVVVVAVVVMDGASLLVAVGSSWVRVGVAAVEPNNAQERTVLDARRRLSKMAILTTID